MSKRAKERIPNPSMETTVQTTVQLHYSSSGVWLGPLAGCGFKSLRGLIQGLLTFVLTVVDKAPMQLSSMVMPEEPSLATLVFKKWPEPLLSVLLPGE